MLDWCGLRNPPPLGTDGSMAAQPRGWVPQVRSLVAYCAAMCTARALQQPEAGGFLQLSCWAVQHHRHGAEALGGAAALPLLVGSSGRRPAGNACLLGARVLVLCAPYVVAHSGTENLGCDHNIRGYAAALPEFSDYG